MSKIFTAVATCVLLVLSNFLLFTADSLKDNVRVNLTVSAVVVVIVSVGLVYVAPAGVKFRVPVIVYGSLVMAVSLVAASGMLMIPDSGANDMLGIILAYPALVALDLLAAVGILGSAIVAIMSLYGDHSK